MFFAVGFSCKHLDENYNDDVLTVLHAGGISSQSFWQKLKSAIPRCSCRKLSCWNEEYHGGKSQGGMRGGRQTGRQGRQNHRHKDKQRI
jgi:hypothetical protein